MNDRIRRLKQGIPQHLQLLQTGLFGIRMMMMMMMMMMMDRKRGRSMKQIRAGIANGADFDVRIKT